MRRCSSLGGILVLIGDGCRRSLGSGADEGINRIPLFQTNGRCPGIGAEHRPMVVAPRPSEQGRHHCGSQKGHSVNFCPS
jgi:hypothetical protein